MIENSQIQTLMSVAKNGSFSGAAKQLNVTQSAISQSIKNLENKLGVDLFLRKGKKVILTPEGKKLFSLGKEYLEKLHDTLIDIQQNTDEMIGKIRIGTMTGVGQSWLAPTMIQFSKQFPEVSLEISMKSAPELLADFDAGILDCFIVPEYALPTNTHNMSLGHENCILIYPPEYIISNKVTYEELCQYPVILYEHSDTLYKRWFEKRFGKVPSNPHRRFIINSHRSMLDAVSCGLGIAVVPAHVLEVFKYEGQVCTLGDESRVESSEFFLVSQKRDKLGKKFTVLMDYLTQTLSKRPF